MIQEQLNYQNRRRKEEELSSLKNKKFLESPAKVDFSTLANLD